MKYRGLQHDLRLTHISGHFPFLCPPTRPALTSLHYWLRVLGFSLGSLSERRPCQSFKASPACLPQRHAALVNLRGALSPATNKGHKRSANTQQIPSSRSSSKESSFLFAASHADPDAATSAEDSLCRNASAISIYFGLLRYDYLGLGLWPMEKKGQPTAIIIIIIMIIVLMATYSLPLLTLIQHKFLFHALSSFRANCKFSP